MTKLPFPDAALEETVAILGMIGSGKTYAAKGIVEYLLTRERRVCIIDPTGVWYGLKALANGKPGFPVVVFGGDHADIPITEDHGTALGKMIGDPRMPASIIDVSGLLLSEQRRFMTAFAESIFHTNRKALHLVIDEADAFMPQKPQPDQTTMLNRWDRVVRRGRVRGFRVTMITQRPAVLNKDVLSMAGTLIAMKLTSPQDRDAIERWLVGQADREKGKAIINGLPKLKRGEGNVWSPGHEILKVVTFPKIKTFDSSRTPGEGEADPAETKLKFAPLDLDAIVAKLREATPAPKGKRRQGSMLPAPATSVTITSAAPMGRQEIKAIEADAFERGRRKGYVAGHNVATEAAAGALKSVQAEIAQALVDVAKRLRADSARPITWPDEPASGTVLRFVAKHTNTAPPLSDEDRSARLEGAAGGAEIGLLRVLIGRAPNALSGKEWSTLAIMKPTGSTFRTYVSRLRSRGLIHETDGKKFTPSNAGIQAAGAVTRPSPLGVIADWKRKLGAGPAAILQYLVEQYPNGRARDEIGERCNMQAGGSTLRTYLSRLKSSGLIDAVSGADFKAAPILFLDETMAA